METFLKCSWRQKLKNKHVLLVWKQSANSLPFKRWILECELGLLASSFYIVVKKTRNMKFTSFKCAAQQCSVCSRCCEADVQNSFNFQTKISCQLNNPPIPPPPAPRNHHSASHFYEFAYSSCKWNHTVFFFWWLTYFT